MPKHYPTPTKFMPKHPIKYIGDVNNITSRSSWELRFMKWADSNVNVIKWASEEVIIPYHSPVDNRQHRYFTDFAIQVKNKTGELKKYIIEIKPDIQTRMPNRGKRTTNKYLTELSTYATNQAKWFAADKFCKQRGMEFMILTEKHLF